MGGALRKQLRSKPCEDPAELKQIIVHLEAQIQQLKKEKKREERAHRKELLRKQAEWNQEKKFLEEEINALASCCEQQSKSEGLQLLELTECEWSQILVEQIKEQKQREEAVEKWKRLYLAIKNELDHLIQATTILSSAHQGEERLVLEWMKEEMKAKEDLNEGLKAKVVEMEKASAKREREVDILRQSIRIMNTNPAKRQSTRTNMSRSLQM
ncbi:uncharacterized protein LOC116253344 [Nymphaea colorata]|nr:uncharacterized protein LOC116253344 [Nymphaea colorata]